MVEIGVFGGSGFYDFLDRVEMIGVETPYGEPSDKIAVAELAGRRVAFLPRHGSRHDLPPHRINYRANVWAMHSLGVTRLICPCAAGSLQHAIVPGDFVVCDDMIDWTNGRQQTFYDGPQVVHISGMDGLYCPELRRLAVQAVNGNGVTCHDRGTIVVVNGPRFSSRAESRLFINQGWQVVNMTQYPENYLARELNMCVVNISLITDYDVGVEGVEPSSVEKIIAVFQANNSKLRSVLFDLIAAIPGQRENCRCADTVEQSTLHREQ
ncbi:MAG: S-methyl-5'-thioadenosine phosphorylase [Negativicutes bacterium]|nr:S-methyl-5'-thioadenosine phosphorylase [Negativicutes bacterium]